MKICLFLLATLSITFLMAADGEYAVSKIDTALLRNANAVKRFEEIRFEVKELNKAKYYRTYIITILNEKGDKFAVFSEYYDKLQSIESIEGFLYDAAGNKIKSVKKSDIQDRSASGDNNLADDNRVKVHNFYHKVYPYTIKYVEEVKYNYTMFYPGWIPVEDENFAVEYSSMIVTLPPGTDFRYKLFNNVGQPLITEGKEEKSYRWELKNYAAIDYEYKSPHWYEITPVVAMGPVQFQIEDYKGNMGSWSDYGKFVFALKEGKDKLPDNIKQTVHQLTDGLKDTRQKIETLYKFLQNNTRYISIQLGIGGWQPFDATYVAQKKYGDCKALTNYMYALLGEAGIKSNYTLIKSGSQNKFFMNDFPSSQFNHVILSVPLNTDTVWLECTSQTLAPGYLSYFTDDRYALVVNENGGTLVRTPKYGLDENLQIRITKAKVDDGGNTDVDVSTVYKALQQDNLQGMINVLSKEKVKELLNERFDLPNYTLNNFSYKEEKSSIPIIRESLQISAANYATMSGKRLFITPNILTKYGRKLIPDDKRKYDIVQYLEYRDIDTVEIKIPKGYEPENLPKDVSLVTQFGKYTASVKIIENKITYYRLMEQYGGRFPAKDYNEMVKFYDQIYKADRNKVILVKKE
ncbi:MAG TPA: DUF3857 domain-containing protein [Chitinophagaceae bacterium]|nr:DUF3857 domain-containing protein [Chitinophagaceae bacterium]